MPSLDELPALNSISGLSNDDLFPVLDVTGAGSSRLRKITLLDLVAATQERGSGTSVATVQVTEANVKAFTAQQPMTFIHGTFTDTAASGVVTVTLPSAGNLTFKSVTISAAFNQTFTTGGAVATLVVSAPAPNTLFTPASGTAVPSVILPIGFVYQFKTDGTNWYRVS